MTEIIQVIVLGLLQGVAKLFPIGSLGHTVIIPAYLGWGNLNTSRNFLPIVVTLHLGTALALVAFYWRDWAALCELSLKRPSRGGLDADPQGKTIWLVIVGTIPGRSPGPLPGDIYTERFLFVPLAGFDGCLPLCQRHHSALWGEYARPRYLSGCQAGEEDSGGDR